MAYWKFIFNYNSTPIRISKTYSAPLFCAKQVSLLHPLQSRERDSNPRPEVYPAQFKAGGQIRTGDLLFTKQLLYHWVTPATPLLCGTLHWAIPAKVLAHQYFLTATIIFNKQKKSRTQIVKIWLVGLGLEAGILLLNPCPFSKPFRYLP